MSLRVREAGPDHAHAPAVWLIHGMLFDSSMWDPIAERLARRYRVVWADLRGHGGSSVSDVPLTPQLLADDQFWLMEQLGIGRCALVGFSLGGLISVFMALESAQRFTRLVLSNTSASPERGLARLRLLAMAAVVRVAGPLGLVTGETVKAMFSHPFRKQHPEIVRSWRKRLSGMSGHGMHAVARMVANRPDMLARTVSIELPTLVIGSSRDTVTPIVHAQNLAQTIPDARLAIIDGAGHGSPIEQPDAWLGHVETFLRTP